MKAVSDLELMRRVEANTREVSVPNAQLPPRTCSRSRASAAMPQASRFFSAVSPEGPAPMMHHGSGGEDDSVGMADMADMADEGGGKLVEQSLIVQVGEADTQQA